MDDGIVQTFEIEQQLGNNVVRTVSMGSTDGLRRGMQAVSDGAPITVPVGPATLGRLFNVVGDPIDKPVRSRPTSSIRSIAPRHRLTSRQRRPKSSKRVSRSST